MSLLEQLPAPLNYIAAFPWRTEVPASQYDSTIQYPKISVITPSFNQGHFIEETIRSVLLQNYPNLEYIIIDGGSTDDTIQILEKYSPFISYWVSEKDKGQSDAINKGIARATGTIFHWLNSDDTYLPNALFLVAKHWLSQATNAVCLASYYVLEDGQRSNFNKPTAIYPTLVETLGRASMNQPGLFLNLDYVKQIGGVNQQLHYSMDWELWIRYLLTFGQEKIICDNTPVTNFRLQKNSKTSQEANNALSSKFECEIFNVYYNLAGQSRNLGLIHTLQQLNIPTIPEYQLAPTLLSENLNNINMTEVIHIYLYQQTFRYYYQGQYNNAYRFARLINKLQLPKHLQADLAYLNRRIWWKKWFSKL